MNNVFISGNLVADPAVRVVGSNLKVCSVSVGVKDRVGKGKPATTSFFDLEMWNKTAELVGQYFVKGQTLSVVGALKQESYTNKKGEQVKRIKITVDEIINLPSSKSAPQPQEVNVGGDYNSDEDLPF